MNITELKMEMVKIIAQTYDEALQTPELAHFHEAIHFLNHKPVGSLFPAKYEAATHHVAAKKTLELFKNSPQMPLKMVISTIMAGFNDDLSADLILKMTPKIIEKWEQLTYEVAAQKSEAVLV